MQIKTKKENSSMLSRQRKPCPGTGRHLLNPLCYQKPPRCLPRRSPAAQPGSCLPPFQYNHSIPPGSGLQRSLRKLSRKAQWEELESSSPSSSLQANHG